MQKKAQYWAYLIAVLGGAIAFHKCVWQMIGWNYEKFPPEMKQQSEQSIKLTDREVKDMEIRQLTTDQLNVGLG